MANEIAKTTGYIVPMLDENRMAEISGEMLGLSLSLDKVKFPSGGVTVFELPGETDSDTETVKEITGVIVDHFPMNAYWREKYNGQNTPPNCFSSDFVNGIGTPGGSCAICPYNKFGSGEDGKSKLCKNMHRLYILRSGEMFPIMLTVPPTSLRPLSNFLAKRIMAKGLYPYGVVTRITLKKETSSTGILYSRMQFAVAEKLDASAADVMKAYAESIKAITRSVDILDEHDDIAVDPDTGEFIAPLV